MFSKVFIIATILVATNAGLAPVAYSAPAYHAPLSYAAALLSYYRYPAPAAHVTYAAPAAHFAYSAPAAHYAYPAPAFAKVAAPIAYTAPAAHLAYAAPVVAKVAAPVAYAAPAAHLAYATPAVAKISSPVLAKTVISEEYDANPQYSYAYNIEDALTGDSKNQHETRNGDLVQGSYSLNDSDGTRRIVDYTSDPVNGFNAIVRKEPLVAKVAAAHVPIAAPIAKLHTAILA